MIRLTSAPSFGAAMVTISPVLWVNPLRFHVAILDRRKHGAEEQHGTIG